MVETDSKTLAIDTLPTEEWFLAKIGESNPPWAEILQSLHVLYTKGHAEMADGIAELLQEETVGRGDREHSLALLEMRLRYHADDPGFRKTMGDVLGTLFAKDILAKRMMENMGLDKGLPLTDCYRRLRLLMSLQPGVFCFDKTWGSGVIKRLDGFYAKVTIDFDKKNGHEMTFAYAAETIQVLRHDHILAIKRTNPAHLSAMVKEQPDEVVRVVLRSCGPTPIQILQEYFATYIPEVTDWKAFWDSARKRLKDDPLIEIPSKRSEPMRLLERAKAFDEAWFESFRRERMIPTILDNLEALVDAQEERDLPPECREAVADRLRFVQVGAGERNPDWAARLLLISPNWTFTPPVVDAPAIAKMLLVSSMLRTTFQRLPARYHRLLLDCLHTFDGTTLVKNLLTDISELPSGLLAETVSFLVETGYEKECRARFLELTGARKLTPTIMGWITKNLDKVPEWSAVGLADMPEVVIEVLSFPYSGEMLKAANQLEALLMQKIWLQQTVGAMSADHKRHFAQRLQAMAATRAPVDVQGLLARLIVLFPEIATISQSDTAASEKKAMGRVTSWRTLKERQKLLQKIISEDIPANSRDIAVARSYGDLRENFEYKTAKEQQGLLLRRRGELEQDLAQIHGTDFANIPLDLAGPGTTVTLKYGDGRQETYHILGEWDQDAELKIISCSSRLAQVLHGLAAGSNVQVPDDKGTPITCTLETISTLPEEIKTWIRSEP